MNMASTSLFIFPIIFIMGNAKSFVSVKCNDTLVVQHGQESLLECVLKTSDEVEDLQIRKVIWKKHNGRGALLEFDEGVTEKQTGYSFAEPSWNNRCKNVSLLISHTTVQHGGVYKCLVFTNSGYGASRIDLEVTAKYSPPTVSFIPGKTTPNMDDTLLCTSGGGYPKGQLCWLDVHDKECMSSAKMEAREMEDGLFELSSRLTLQSGSISSQYTCVVFNAVGVKEDEFTFVEAESTTIMPRQNEVFGEKPVYNIVAPVVVIGSLVIGLLLTLIIYRWKCKKNSRRVPEVSVVEYVEGDLEEVKPLEDYVG